MKSRVFIVQASNRYDVSGAEQFGKIVYLVDHGFNLFDTEHIINVLSRALCDHDYDPEVDFICLTGQAILIAMFGMIVVACYEGPIKILIFDSRTGGYQSRNFNPG